MTPEPEKTVLTQSAVRAFRKCQRLYSYSYHQLYRPLRVGEALEYGTLWHQLRETWWLGGIEAATHRLETMKAVKVAQTIGNGGDPWDPYLEARLVVMLKGYHARWGHLVHPSTTPFHAQFQVLGVESQFDIPMVNPRTGKKSTLYQLQGAIDAVIRDRTDGRIWVVEEKTAKGPLELDSPYWKRLEIDPQISLYFSAVEALFQEKPAGIIYMVNVKPQLQPKMATPEASRRYTAKGLLDARQRLEDESPQDFAVRLAEAVAEDPERYYHLVRIAKLESDITESQADIWDSAKAIREAEKSGTWLRNPDSCIHPYGGSCPFLPVCAHRGQLTDLTLYRKATTAHEELVKKEDT